MRTMEVTKCVPTMIRCEPQEEFPLAMKHQFEATKVYSMIDSDGSEFGIVICPKHLLPIRAKLVHKSGEH